MALRSWLAAVLSQPVRPGPARRAGRGVRLALEPLEDRRTPTSMSLVKNILAGAGASSPQNPVNLNGMLFFSADDGISGVELWRSDGTAAGTFLLKDINPDAASSSPGSLTSVNGMLFFSADDGVNGRELWRSDGTAAGTFLLKDLSPGAASSNLVNLTIMDGTLFGIDDSSLRLWRSDGTPAGTVMVGNFYFGSGSVLNNLTSSDGTLFFTADDGISGAELWKSDGTAGGTSPLKDINPGPASSSPENLTSVNGALFFTANDGTNGPELWKSDGTEAGTVLVKDINPNAAGSLPVSLTNVNGTLFFRATDGFAHGQELWRSDGTEAGTVLVQDINPGPASSSPQSLTEVNGTLFFTAIDGTNGRELWKSDGTAAGTALVQDIFPGAVSSIPLSLTNVNGTLFFQADDGINGQELWKSDGTEAGTVLVQVINPGPASSAPASLTNVNGTLFFAADDGTNGLELWKAAEFSDDFNRPDSTTLGSGWTEVAGNLAVVGNELMTVGLTGGTALANGVMLADVRVEAWVSVLTTGNSRADLLGRASSATAAYFGSLVGNNGTLTAVIRRGTAVLASAPVTEPLGEGVLRFEVAGSLLRLLFNDALVASAFDSTYKSGKVGVRGTQFVGFDDFFASPVDPDMPFGDSFDRNVDSTSLGNQWREQAGDLVVVGNQLATRGTGNNLGIYPWGAMKDVSVHAQVNVLAPAGSALSGNAGLMARYGGSGDRNYYLGALVGVNGVFTSRIYRNSGGTLTQLASAAVGSGSGLLRFEVIGNSLKLFVNGVLAVKTTDTRLTAPGQVGVRGTPRSTFDTFNAQRLFATLFYDGFNRSDAADQGPVWKALKGSVGILTGQAKATATGTNLAVRDGVLLKDVRLETTVALPGVGVEEAGLVARVKDANNYYYAALDGNAGSYSVSIYKVVGGVKTRIGAAAAVGSGTGTLRFEAVGNALTLWFNGVQMVNVTNSVFTAAGLAGVRGSLNTTFDDFNMA